MSQYVLLRGTTCTIPDAHKSFCRTRRCNRSLGQQGPWLLAVLANKFTTVRSTRMLLHPPTENKLRMLLPLHTTKTAAARVNHPSCSKPSSSRRQHLLPDAKQRVKDSSIRQRSRACFKNIVTSHRIFDHCHSKPS